MLRALAQRAIPKTLVLAVVEQARAVTTLEVPTKAVELYHPLATVTREVGPWAAEAAGQTLYSDGLDNGAIMLRTVA